MMFRVALLTPTYREDYLVLAKDAADAEAKIRIYMRGVQILVLKAQPVDNGIYCINTDPMSSATR